MSESTSALLIVDDNEDNRYTLMRRLQRQVIMISALDEMDSVIRCTELGAEDYLAKPFDPTLLRARVGASLEKKRLLDELFQHVRRMEKELEAARAVQLSMVPVEFAQPTAEQPFSIHATLQPAHEVGETPKWT